MSVTVCMSTCLCVYVLKRPCASLSICLCDCMPMFLSIDVFMSLCLYVCVSVCVPDYVSACMSFSLDISLLVTVFFSQNLFIS